MSDITYVTTSKIPSNEAFLMDRFILLNMGIGTGGGIWLVDKEHPDWDKIKEAALITAKMFGDKDQIKKLTD